MQLPRRPYTPQQGSQEGEVPAGDADRHFEVGPHAGLDLGRVEDVPVGADEGYPAEEAGYEDAGLVSSWE